MRCVSALLLSLGLVLCWPSGAVAAAPSEKPGLQVLKGTFTGKDADARYLALVENGRLLQVTEYRDRGERGRSVATFRFEDGALAVFTETAERGGTAGQRTTLQLFFEKGRFTGGSKNINGSTAEPDEEEKRRALAQADEARRRVEARLQARLQAPVVPLAPDVAPVPPAATGSLPAVAFDCEDGSTFVAHFDNEGRRAVIEAEGAEPISLPELPVGSGFRYSDGQTGLRGKGDEAVFRTADGRSVRCRVSGKTAPAAN